MPSHRLAAEKLREFVDRTGLTAADVAARLGISGAALSGYLKGTLVPRRLVVRRAIERFTAGVISAAEWETPEERERIDSVVPFVRPKGAA